MTIIYQGKIYVRFFELLLLKYDGNVVFFIKLTLNKIKVLFFLEKDPFRYVMFGGFLYIYMRHLIKYMAIT